MSNFNIEFKCAQCGSKDFEYPEDPKPDDYIICTKCGSKEKYGIVSQQAIEQAEKFITDMAKDAFKDLSS